jgi:hypothetical protein
LRLFYSIGGKDRPEEPGYYGNKENKVQVVKQARLFSKYCISTLKTQDWCACGGQVHLHGYVRELIAS